MKSIDPLSADDADRQRWNDRPVEQETPVADSMPSAESADPSMQQEHFLQPVDMSSLYPQIADRQGPLPTGTVSASGQEHVADIEHVSAPQKRGVWSLGVYIIGLLILADVVTLFLSGREPSIFEAVVTILTATLAFGLLTWRELARKICVAMLVIIIGLSWWSVYTAHQLQSALQTQIATHEDAIARMRIGGATSALIEREESRLAEAKETQQAWPSFQRALFVRAATAGVFYGAAVVYLSLPRIRQEFS